MTGQEHAAIDTLAELAGIEPDYIGTDGQVRNIPAETKRAVLNAMGFDLSTPAAVRSWLHERDIAAWRRLVAPVIVLRWSPSAAVSVTLPETLLDQTIEWCLTTETGETFAGALPPDSLEVQQHHTVDGMSFVRLCMPLSHVPDIGYHRFAVTIGGLTSTSMLICTPPAAFTPDWLQRGERRWGIACPLFSLWSASSWGIGDFTDLATLARGARNLGASVIGLNPLHAPLPDAQSDPNPYLPSSRLFLNPAFIDLRGQTSFSERVAGAQATGAVDYPAVNQLKRDALEAMFRSREWRDDAALAAFRRQQGQALERFAVFNALQERFPSTTWRDWPAEFRTAASQGVRDFAGEQAHLVDFHIWVQWLADRQLAAAAAELSTTDQENGLYRDLAVGICRTGADAWADQDVYVGGASIGAPPDPFGPAGQDWGAPPPSPVALADCGYVPFIAALRANMRHARVLRIDHVMGLQRLYWVPAGYSPRDGAYVRYPIDDLLGIVALESCRNRCLVVGEDLGTLPWGFHERMAEANVLSYRLMMFERYKDGLFRRPSTYPRSALATFGTHDLPTIAGWWEGYDIDIRRSLDLDSVAADLEMERRKHDRALLFAALRDQNCIAAETADEAAIADLILAVERFLARTPSALMVANLGDMLAEMMQINVPGTVSEHPNWRHRFRMPVDALAAEPLVQRIAAAIASERSVEVAQPA